MGTFRVDTDALEWQSAAPGSRFKAFRTGERLLRLLELTPEFVEHDYCRKGHLGIVLEGDLEIEFGGGAIRYPQGSILAIPAGAAGAHRARPLSPVVRLFLVEDA